MFENQSSALQNFQQQLVPLIESIFGKAALPTILAVFDSGFFYLKAGLLIILIIGLLFVAGSLILDG